jgi:LPXTG-motif cell wall-anchored protein
MKRYEALTRAQPKRLYRRQMDAPARLPMGDDGGCGCGDFGQTPFQPEGSISRGVFDQIQPYAVPGYVAKEPDGVDGWYDRNAHTDGMSDWFDMSGASATLPMAYGFGATPTGKAFIERLLDEVLDYVEHQVNMAGANDIIKPSTIMDGAFKFIKDGSDGWKNYFKTKALETLTTVDTSVFGTGGVCSGKITGQVTTLVLTALDTVWDGLNSTVKSIVASGIENYINKGVSYGLKIICAEKLQCPSKDIPVCPGDPAPPIGRLIAVANKGYEVVKVYDARSNATSKSNMLFHKIGSGGATGWSASTATDNPGFMIYGPYVTYADTTERLASFRLLTDSIKNHPKASVVLQVQDATDDTTVTSFEVYRDRLAAPYKYTTFNLTFTPVVGHEYEYRVYWRDNTYVRVSTIAVAKRSNKFPSAVVRAVSAIESDATVRSYHVPAATAQSQNITTLGQLTADCKKAGGAGGLTAEGKPLCCPAYDYETNVKKCATMKCHYGCKDAGSYTQHASGKRLYTLAEYQQLSTGAKFTTFTASPVSTSDLKTALIFGTKTKGMGKKTVDETGKSSNLPLIVAGAGVAALAAYLILKKKK